MDYGSEGRFHERDLGGSSGRFLEGPNQERWDDGASVGGLEGCLEDTLQSVSKGTPKGIPRGFPKGVSKGTTKAGRASSSGERHRPKGVLAEGKSSNSSTQPLAGDLRGRQEGEVEIETSGFSKRGHDRRRASEERRRSLISRTIVRGGGLKIKGEQSSDAKEARRKVRYESNLIITDPASDLFTQPVPDPAVDNNTHCKAAETSDLNRFAARSVTDPIRGSVSGSVGGSLSDSVAGSVTVESGIGVRKGLGRGFGRGLSRGLVRSRTNGRRQKKDVRKVSSANAEAAAFSKRDSREDSLRGVTSRESLDVGKSASEEQGLKGKGRPRRGKERPSYFRSFTGRFLTTSAAPSTSTNCLSPSTGQATTVGHSIRSPPTVKTGSPSSRDIRPTEQSTQTLTSPLPLPLPSPRLPLEKGLSNRSLTSGGLVSALSARGLGGSLVLDKRTSSARAARSNFATTNPALSVKSSKATSPTDATRHTQLSNPTKVSSPGKLSDPGKVSHPSRSSQELQGGRDVNSGRGLNLRWPSMSSQSQSQSQSQSRLSQESWTGVERSGSRTSFRSRPADTRRERTGVARGDVEEGLGGRAQRVAEERGGGLQANALLEGTAQKWTGYYRSWRPRFLRIVPGALLYADSETSPVKQCIPLRYCAIKINIGTEKELQIFEAKRTLLFRFADKAERQLWASTLTRAKMMANDFSMSVDDTYGSRYGHRSGERYADEYGEGLNHVPREGFLHGERSGYQRPSQSHPVGSPSLGSPSLGSPSPARSPPRSAPQLPATRSRSASGAGYAASSLYSGLGAGLATVSSAAAWVSGFRGGGGGGGGGGGDTPQNSAQRNSVQRSHLPVSSHPHLDSNTPQEQGTLQSLRSLWSNAHPGSPSGVPVAGPGVSVRGTATSAGSTGRPHASASASGSASALASGMMTMTPMELMSPTSGQELDFDGIMSGYGGEGYGGDGYGGDGYGGDGYGGLHDGRLDEGETEQTEIPLEQLQRELVGFHRDSSLIKEEIWRLQKRLVETVALIRDQTLGEKIREIVAQLLGSVDEVNRLLVDHTQRIEESVDREREERLSLQTSLRKSLRDNYKLQHKLHKWFKQYGHALNRDHTQSSGIVDTHTPLPVPGSSLEGAAPSGGALPGGAFRGGVTKSEASFPGALELSVTRTTKSPGPTAPVPSPREHSRAVEPTVAKSPVADEARAGGEIVTEHFYDVTDEGASEPVPAPPPPPLKSSPGSKTSRGLDERGKRSGSPSHPVHRSRGSERHRSRRRGKRDRLGDHHSASSSSSPSSRESSSLASNSSSSSSASVSASGSRSGSDSEIEIGNGGFGVSTPASITPTASSESLRTAFHTGDATDTNPENETGLPSGDDGRGEDSPTQSPSLSPSQYPTQSPSHPSIQALVDLSGDLAQHVKQVPEDDELLDQVADLSWETTLAVSPRLGFERPRFEWRRRLEMPRTSVKISLWSLLKDCVGKDLTRVALPVYFNEPTSFLQRLAEDYQYAVLLERAAAAKDPQERLLFTAVFTCTPFASAVGRTYKPFNPLLGETYELIHRGYLFHAEQVGHHPPTTAFNAQGKNFASFGHLVLNTKFTGKSLEISMNGPSVIHLTRPRDGHLSPSLQPGFLLGATGVAGLHTEAAAAVVEAETGVEAEGQTGVEAEGQTNAARVDTEAAKAASVSEGDWITYGRARMLVNNVIFGKISLDMVGTALVVNHSTGDVALIEYPRRGWWSSAAEGVHPVRGAVVDATGACHFRFEGSWSSRIRAFRVDPSRARVDIPLRFREVYKRENAAPSEDGRSDHERSSGDEVSVEQDEDEDASQSESESERETHAHTHTSPPSRAQTGMTGYGFGHSDGDWRAGRGGTTRGCESSAAPTLLRYATAGRAESLERRRGSRRTENRRSDPDWASGKDVRGPAPIPELTAHEEKKLSSCWAALTEATVGEGWLLWEPEPRPPKSSHYYDFGNMTFEVNEISPLYDRSLGQPLPPTDSRLRPDQRALELGQIERSNAEKIRLEEAQRAASRKRGGVEDHYQPNWYRQKSSLLFPDKVWTFNPEYWRPRHQKLSLEEAMATIFQNCPDIF